MREVCVDFCSPHLERIARGTRADKGVRPNAYLAALAALAHPLTHLQTSPHTSPHTFFQHLAATTVS